MKAKQQQKSKSFESDAGAAENMLVGFSFCTVTRRKNL